MAFKELQGAIGEWSRENFGDQTSKTETRFIPFPLVLGSLAPLLGIVEEAGELKDACSRAEALDAIADIGIYLCDYAQREGFVLPNCIAGTRSDDSGTIEPPPSEELLSVFRGQWKLQSIIGKLARVTLKHHQGIRGYDDFDKYREDRDSVVFHLLQYLDCLTWDLSKKTGEAITFLDILGQTWTTIVKKRNWTEDPAGGLMEGDDMLAEKEPEDSEDLSGSSAPIQGEDDVEGV